MFQELLKPLIAEESEQNSKQKKVSVPSKAHIADELEAEAKAPREKKFKMPSGQVLLLTYLIDKYGDDYQVRIAYYVHVVSMLLFPSFE